MKLTLAIILTAAFALFFITSTIPPREFSDYFSKLFLIISVLGLLLSLCILPWLRGSFSDKWVIALKYGLLIAFSSFDLGYLLFSLSILI
jgi:hypothetical protein